MESSSSSKIFFWDTNILASLWTLQHSYCVLNVKIHLRYKIHGEHALLGLNSVINDDGVL